jgi:hypothetical protein
MKIGTGGNLHRRTDNRSRFAHEMARNG